MGGRPLRVTNYADRPYGSNRQFLDLLGEAIHTTSHALGQHRRRIAREHPTAA